MPSCVFIRSRGKETIDEGDTSITAGSPAHDGLVGDESVGRQVSHHLSSPPGYTECPVPRPPPLPSNVPDLHSVYCDDRRCFGGRLPTKNDDTMTTPRQAHCVLSQYTLRAADHLPWGDIGEQENFHTNQCNG